MQRTIYDIDVDIRNLNHAIKHHYEWSNRLLEISLFGGDFDKSLEDKNSQGYCDFGKWIDAALIKYDFNENDLLRISDSHMKMHQTVRDIIAAIKVNAFTHSQLKEYFYKQKNFLDAVDTYKSSLLANRSAYDALTELPMRNKLINDFPRLQARCAQSDKDLYLIILDVDHFKQVNDRYGHNGGDTVLKGLANLLLGAMRKDEKCYRYGGEEFVILVEGENLHDIKKIIERLMIKIRGEIFLYEDNIINITVTFGISPAKTDCSLEDIIALADKAMYYGKQYGRDVCMLNHNDEIGVLYK
ncbi:diguanylate cyclase [Pantoea sp.]|uniref:diguanylate cyclase n=1 Tax=Pantoea sp. TaxID=69393 RepID=UPI0028AE2CB9|nr:diguanylate cyclase [Pantoea sp.]